MWFAVTYNKDGSIHSCVEKDRSVDTSGRIVHYIQAPDRAAAVKIAALKWEHAKREAARAGRYNDSVHIAKGMCRKCSRTAQEGHSQCSVCIERAVAAKRRMRGEYVPYTKPTTPYRARVELNMLNQVSVAFEKGTASFRVWLKEQIGVRERQLK